MSASRFPFDVSQMIIDSFASLSYIAITATVKIKLCYYFSLIYHIYKIVRTLRYLQLIAQLSPRTSCWGSWTQKTNRNSISGNPLPVFSNKINMDYYCNNTSHHSHWVLRVYQHIFVLSPSRTQPNSSNDLFLGEKSKVYLFGLNFWHINLLQITNFDYYKCRTRVA